MTQPRQTLRPPIRHVQETYTAVTAATYTAKAGDRVVGVNRAGSVTITLPTAELRPGRIYTVKDESGAAATNNITVATEGAETIDGSATDVIDVNYESKSYYSDGTDWFILPITPDTNTQLTLATTVSTQAHGDAAAPGSASTASKGDHKHAMPAAGVGAVTREGGNTTEATTTSLTAVDLLAASSLSISATTPFTVMVNCRSSAAGDATGDPKITVGKINTTVCQEAITSTDGALGWSSPDGTAEDGMLVYDVGSRVTNYLRAGIGHYQRSDGSNFTQQLARTNDDATFPTATITDITARAISDDTVNPDPTMGADEMHVYSWATS